MSTNAEQVMRSDVSGLDFHFDWSQFLEDGEQIIASRFETDLGLLGSKHTPAVTTAYIKRVGKHGYIENTIWTNRRTPPVTRTMTVYGDKSLRWYFGKLVELVRR